MTAGKPVVQITKMLNVRWKIKLLRISKRGAISIQMNRVNDNAVIHLRFGKFSLYVYESLSRQEHDQCIYHKTLITTL